MTKMQDISRYVRLIIATYITAVCNYVATYVTGFVKIDPNHTGTEIHFITEQ